VKTRMARTEKPRMSRTGSPGQKPLMPRYQTAKLMH
jgi:hypothetical protein